MASCSYQLLNAPQSACRRPFTSAKRDASFVTPRRCGRAEVNRQRVFAGEEVVDITFDVIAKNERIFRALPLVFGGLGLVGTLVNRTISGIAPVVDASSGQSRADVLVIALSAILLLTGLQWLSIKPKALTEVDLTGKEVAFQEDGVPPRLVEELNWAWEAINSATRAKSLVVFFQGRALCHRGLSNTEHTPGQAKQGAVVSKAIQTGQGNYLANLVLYPGRLEFVQYLPEDTQGVVVQPVGSLGALVVGTNAVRGMSRVDQAWIASIADKLEVSMEGIALVGKGFGAKPKARSR